MNHLIELVHFKLTNNIDVYGACLLIMSSVLNLSSQRRNKNIIDGHNVFILHVSKLQWYQNK